MRPAKRRQGRSAMRILINDKAVDELTPKVVKSLMLSKVQSVTLDRAMLENGLLLVDNAWRKLSAATP